MFQEQETSQDAITAEEMQDTAVPKPQAVKKRIEDLMAPKSKKPSPATVPKAPRPVQKHFSGRDGLGAYIQDPASFPASQVIYHTPTFTAIHDKFPKSSVHTLLLPRGPQTLTHPFAAFDDAEFLASVRAEVPRLKSIVAAELRRRYGKFSTEDREPERVLDGGELADGSVDGELPGGRDWEKEVMVGVHAHPSMSHLHVHVLSVDRYSDCLKHRKHYNSFSTRFFVPLDDFPLAPDDERRHPGRMGFLDEDFRCWRCGEGFGNRFKVLKEHLAEEFEEWKTK